MNCILRSTRLSIHLFCMTVSVMYFTRLASCEDANEKEMLLLIASVMNVCDAATDMALASSSVKKVMPTKNCSWYPAGLLSRVERIAKPPTERSLCAMRRRTSVEEILSTLESGYPSNTCSTR